jgi:thymidylate synthase
MQDLVGDVHITYINNDFGCDQFLRLPQLYCSYEVQLASNAIYRLYHTPNYEENQFLQLMSDIITYGEKRSDRTGAGTLSLFSRELRFNLSTGKIPMMTTRPVSLRYVFEELMWILRGQTNNKILNEKKIHIWDANTTREFLDKRELNNLPEGDIGPSYGFQMRHFGASYKDCRKNYNQQGFDQLSNVIHLLKTDPTNRRIIMSLWNPAQLDQMALPPCLYGYQFYVSKGYLSCKLIQRSSDIALAGSHNCTAGALLVRMLCIVTGLQPGEVIWSPADIHIYLNQVEAAKDQIKRTPKPFPTLKIIGTPKNNNILNFDFSQLQLLNYVPQDKIQFAMNA